jgi:tetratricopeptide (TPR) repeat protein
MAAVYAKKGDYAAAVRDYRRSLALEPDVSAWNNLGDALERLGELEEAVVCYRRAADLSPDNAIIHRNLAEVLGRLGRTDEAAAELEKARQSEAAREKQP